MPKHDSGRVTGCYWAWASGHGAGDIVKIERRLNAQQYVNILNNVLYPSVIERYPNRNPIFIIEDNSSIHTAGLVNN